jgi:hypothetical protein
MKIKVLFVAETHPDFISRKIMNKMNTHYSHVLIVFDETEVFHAVGKGVCLDNFSEYIKDHVIAEAFNVELKVSREYFLGFVEGSQGKDYSQSQIVGIAGGKEIHNGDGKMICSELVGVVLTRMAGYHIPGCQDTWTPFDCYTSLKSGPVIVH